MVNPELPTVLYKFFADSISESDKRMPFIETECLIRFTQPNSFNDPFEALPIWSLEGLTNEIIDQFFVGNTPKQRNLPYDKARKFKALKLAHVKKTARKNPELLTRILTKQAQRVACLNTGVLSLSATSEAGPMWAHYSNNHAGLCVGFDTSHQFFGHRKDNLIYQVEYTERRPVFPVSQLANPNLRGVIFEKKDERWRYEQEYRVVRALAMSDSYTGNDKYGNRIHLFKVPSECVSQIIVGIRASKDLKKAVLNWKNKHPNTQLFQAAIAQDSYSIVPRSFKI